jgi:hypothetical protein
LEKHPEEASMFSETMVGVHGAEPPAVAAAYDFSGLTTVVDPEKLRNPAPMEFVFSTV